MLLQETLESDTVSERRYSERILVDTAGTIPLTSLLYRVNDSDRVVEVRVLQAHNSAYAQTAMEHLQSTEDRSHALGWHYQQWSFEVP